MINVIVISGISMVREGMRHILSPHDDIRIAAEAIGVEDILARQREASNAVAVIAHPLLTSEKQEIYSRLRREQPRLRVIFIERGNDVDSVFSAMRMGAHGILSTGCPKEYLLDAIRTVSTGKVYVSKEISRLIAADIKSFIALTTQPVLTERELEILRRLAIGRRATVIGDELGISAKTVSAHKANIMGKLALTSVPGLVLYAMENQLFDLYVDHSQRKHQQSYDIRYASALLRK